MKQLLFIIFLAICATSNVHAKNYFGNELFNERDLVSIPLDFSPSYIITSGDAVQFYLTGGYNKSYDIVVDPTGNIFVPNFGPINLRGVPYKELTNTIHRHLSTKYNSQVSVYAYLKTGTPVRVNVTGAVANPGTYSGHNSDNPVALLTLAGGVDMERGSMVDVSHYRNNQLITQYNLYKYKLSGLLELHQFHSGDTLHVHTKKLSIDILGSARFNGEVQIFEEMSGSDLDSIAQPLDTSTHVRISRLDDSYRNVIYTPISKFNKMKLQTGDIIEYISDLKRNDISVRVIGEHSSNFEYTIDKETSLEDLLSKIILNKFSSSHIQLYRKSVKEKQKERLNNSLNQLEKSVLTTSSATESTANLRGLEAGLVMKWIESARQVETKGQVILLDGADLKSFTLEDGDLINIPPINNIVQVNGEVTFPNAVSFIDNLKVRDYIEMAGGLNHPDSRIMILKPTGQTLFAKMSSDIKRGDEILILPHIDEKNFQFAKDLTQILYQIAASAAIIIGV